MFLHFGETMDNNLVKAAIKVLLTNQQSFSCHAVAQAVADRDGGEMHEKLGSRDGRAHVAVEEYEAILREVGHNTGGGDFGRMVREISEVPEDEPIPGIRDAMYHKSDFQRGLRVGFLLAQLKA